MQSLTALTRYSELAVKIQDVRLRKTLGVVLQSCEAQARPRMEIILDRMPSVRVFYVGEV